MKTIFLGRKKEDDRDCCVYIEVAGFECNHYFGGLRIRGACYSGFEKEIREFITEHFEEFETILTQAEALKLFEINDKIEALGYGIEKDSEKYKQGLALLDEFKPITDKLLSNEGKKFFKEVQESEKEYCMQEYDLTRDEIDEVFDYYNLPYQDRGIISYVFKDKDEFGEEEKLSFGYEDIPYFNTEAFANDLLEEEYYLELDSGKIVSLNY